MLPINLHHLYYFYIIAQERQVARAAKRLRIGQPTLSTQLKQFEEILGYRLFDRKRGQTLALTPQGEVFHTYAQEIFRLTDEMLASARGVRTKEELTLKLGVLDWLPKKEVAEIISVAVRRFRCFVSVFEDTANQLLESLSEHKFDLILSNAPPPHSDSHPFRSRRIALLPVNVYGTPRFSHLRGGFPKSLEGQPFILPTAHGRTRHILEEHLRDVGVQVKVVGEAQDGELLRRSVLSGEALVPLSPSTVEREIQHGDLVCVGQLKDVQEELWLIALPRLVEHPVVRYLLSYYVTNPEHRAA